MDLRQWLQQQEEFQEGYSGSTLGGETVVGSDEHAMDGRAVIWQALQFAASQPDIREQIKNSPEWQDEEARNNVKQLLASMGISIDGLE